MLPSILAKQLQKGLGDYIETTFPMTNEPFKGSVHNMLATKDSVYHEPYVAVRLPFRVAESMPTCFEAIHSAYLPYVHQQKAFERLTGDDGRSTLVATGTGSGKTECFLYPILEYCYQHRGERGIKALIIYPMNALASDQAKRIAELIHESPELHGNVTVGMYVGGQENTPNRMMTEHGVITDHETLLNNPPDILMTNYKMLDVMPYNGDANGSSFDGSYTITATLTAPSEIKLYSSTDKNVRGTNVSTVDETLFQELVPTQTLADKNVYELNEDVTALLLKGTLPTFERYVLDITLHPTNNNGGNVYGNSASMEADGLNELTTPISKINVRERTLSGIAWLDANQDGLIGNTEERIQDLTVTLYHTDAITGQETIAKDINNNDCITTTNTNGEYSFTKLPSGTYRVVFTDHSGTPISFADYIVTDKNMGTDEAINSKSDAIKSPENILTSAEIKDITLPALSEMQKNNITIYQKQYQNLGIYRALVNKSVTKVWDDNNNQDGIRPTEIKVQLYANGTPVGNETVLNEDNAWTYTFTDLPQFENGKEIEYIVKEINIPNGYTNHITIDENGNIVVTNTHVPAIVYPPDDSSHNNMHTANTGDASNNLIWILMLVVSVSGAVSILFVKRNRNR